MTFLTAGIPGTIVEAVPEVLERQQGPDFQPAPLLARLAAEGATFATFDRVRHADRR